MGYPSGQREQTVNLPASRLRRFESFPHHLREPDDGGVAPGEEGREGFAGVAQLVERKPSKLDVAGSSPVSRLLMTKARQEDREVLEATPNSAPPRSLGGFRRDNRRVELASLA